MLLSRRLLLLFVGLCALGVLVSIELTRIHVFIHTDPNFHSICAISEGVNCETVAISPYSIFAGLPISVWGIVGYIIMGSLALWAMINKRLHHLWPMGFLSLLTFFSICTSAILAYIAQTRIDAVCPFCMVSYTINLGLFIIIFLLKRRTFKSFIQQFIIDIKTIIAKPLLTTSFGLIILFTIIIMQIFIPRYWQTTGWSDLPKLANGVDSNGHHWIGAKNPQIEIVEFSDYQCPHCRAAHKEIRIRAAAHPELIRLVHRHLPLDMACNPEITEPFHEYACYFAKAAECAALQGYFWEMNDVLFSTQEKLKAKDIDPVILALRLGLNRTEFKKCLEQQKTAQRINNDINDALAKKLEGTPSFIVGKNIFLGMIPAKKFELLLTRNLKKIEVSSKP